MFLALYFAVNIAITTNIFEILRLFYFRKLTFSLKPFSGDIAVTMHHVAIFNIFSMHLFYLYYISSPTVYIVTIF
jgi:hypothetical protein